jgi:hypothetical protein
MSKNVSLTTQTLMIELTTNEKELLAQIELDALALSNDYRVARKNGDLACELMHLLITRTGAIPVHRISYFTKAKYHIGGRGSSRQQIFERNGTADDEIFRHPHFLSHLRYFIFGPDLPSFIVDAFQERIAECYGHITSSDTLPLAKFARQQARTNRLDPRTASEEFFKLGLEYGLDPSQAVFIREQVRTIR